MSARGSRRLESAAYKTIETTERARRADLEARGIHSSPWPTPQGQDAVAPGKVEEAKAVERFDNWNWLLGEIRLALEPITPTYDIVSVADKGRRGNGP